MSNGDRGSPALSWCIHGVTALGVVLGLLGLVAVIDGHAKAALLWLIAAQVLDGVDGPVARVYEVKRNLPKVDGYILDLVVDYVTCVVVPVAFLWRFEMLPGAIDVPLCALVLFTSALWFSRTDMETEDHWFRGFPAVWNVVVPSLYLLNTHSWLNAVVVAFFCVITMTDLPFVHPVRVRALRIATMTVTVVWLTVMTLMTIVLPDAPVAGKVVLIAAPAYLMGLSVWRALRPPQVGVEPVLPAGHAT